MEQRSGFQELKVLKHFKPKTKSPYYGILIDQIYVTKNSGRQSGNRTGKKATRRRNVIVVEAPPQPSSSLHLSLHTKSSGLVDGKLEGEEGEPKVTWEAVDRRKITISNAARSSIVLQNLRAIRKDPPSFVKSKTHICISVAVVADVREEIRFQMVSDEDPTWVACSGWMVPITSGELHHEITYQEALGPAPVSWPPFGSTAEIAQLLLQRLARSDGELEPEWMLARQNALGREQIQHTLEAIAGDTRFQQQMLEWLDRAHQGLVGRGVTDFFFEFLRTLIQQPIWDDRPRKKPNTLTTNLSLGNVFLGAGGEMERENADDYGSKEKGSETSSFAEELMTLSLDEATSELLSADELSLSGFTSFEEGCSMDGLFGSPGNWEGYVPP